MRPVGTAIVGAGYWGPNLLRNFCAADGFEVRWVCDRDQERAEQVVGRYSTIAVTCDLLQVLRDRHVEAVAVATPAETHEAIVAACLEAGKHVLVEKPLASSLEGGERLVSLARHRDRVLMCDHTYCFTPAARLIRSAIEAGDLGDIQYIDSVRINLGIVQPDIDVFWDLAPHDLSILDFVLPDELRPRSVAAHGGDPLGTGRCSVGYLSLPLSAGGIAHMTMNWLSPTKVRTMTIGGSRATLVWDDLNPITRVRMYDRGVSSSPTTQEGRITSLVSYRLGDMVAPALPEKEALALMVGEFHDAIREQRAPITDGESGLRVLRILQTASDSLAADGAELRVPTPHTSEERACVVLA